MSPIKKITSLADSIREKLERVMDEIRDEIILESFMIYKKNLIGRKGWARKSYINRETGDLDFEVGPQISSKTGQGYSVIEAIREDANRSEQAIKFHLSEGGGISGFGLGRIDFLLSLSPRWIYYEYGTLGSQESTGKLGIGSFGQWENPYARWSNLRVNNPEVEWAFRKLKGVGRFGLGIMMPSTTTGSTQVKPIPPIRMYRGSADASKKEIMNSQSKIIKKALRNIRG